MPEPRNHSVSTVEPRSFLAIPAVASLTGGLAGLAIAVLTLRLNPGADASIGDSAALLVWLALLYAVAAGLVASTVALVAGWLVRSGRWRTRVRGALLAWALMLPLFWVFSLPEVAGPFGPLLWAAEVIGLAPLGWLFAVRLPPGFRRVLTRVALLAGTAIALTFVGRGLMSSQGPVLAEQDPASREKGSPAWPAQDRSDETPVVLLCVDGMDPQLLEVMMRSGDMPTFSRLLAEGAYGPLATLEPTLSPAVWTTIVTGMDPEVHGIEGFVTSRFPFMNNSVRRFPMRTGLNFELFERLEKLPGVPHLRAPVIGTLRREPALWNIAEHYDPVGVWSWRVTQPVETLRGFMLAAPVTLSETRAPAASRRHPQDLLRGIERAPRPPDNPDLSAYLAPGQEAATLDPESVELRTIKRSLARGTAWTVPRLMAKYEARLVVSAFYSVDAFNHLFGTQHHAGSGQFAPALGERYRTVDRRLAEFLAGIRGPVNLILLSDHGYDFERDNHSFAPPGFFLAHGPGFQRGRKVNDLSVRDVTPMILYLLGLPTAADMPHGESDSWQAPLDPAWLLSHPPRVIPSWSWVETSRSAEKASDREREEQVLEELRTLGYIE